MADEAIIDLGGDLQPLQSALDQGASMFEEFGDAVQTGLLGPLKPVADVITGIESAFSSVGESVSETFGKVYDAVAGTFDKLQDTVVSVFGAVKDKVTSIFGGLLDGVKSAIKTALSQIPLFMVDISTGLSEGFRGLAEQERNMTRVTAAVASTGGAAGKTAEELNEMANAMQRVTTYGDDVVLGAQAILLQFKNIRGDIFDDALMAAADLAAATGQDLAGAADKLGRVLNNPTQGLRALATEGVYFTKQEQEMIKQMVYAGQVAEAQRIILDRMAGTFKGAAAAAAQSFTGRMQQLANVVGDAWEALADALVPALEAVIPWMEKGAKRLIEFAEGFKVLTMRAVEWVEKSWPVIQSFLDDLMAKAQEAMRWIADRVVEAATAVQTAWQDLPQTWDTIVKKAMAAFQELKLFMLDTWRSVGDAIADAFDDAWTAVRKGFFDMFKPIAEALDKLDGAGIFRKTLDALEKAAETDVTKDKAKKRGKDPFAEEREALREMQEEADAAGGAFGDRFESNLEKNRRMLEGLFGELPSGEGGRGGAGGNSPFIFEQEDGATQPGGAFEDLESLNKRIQGAAIKSDTARAIDGQIAVIKNHHAENKQFQAMQLKKMDEQIAATKETTAVYA